jgi:hypothetical protein
MVIETKYMNFDQFLYLLQNRNQIVKGLVRRAVLLGERYVVDVFGTEKMLFVKRDGVFCLREIIWGNKKNPEIIQGLILYMG